MLEMVSAVIEPYMFEPDAENEPTQPQQLFQQGNCSPLLKSIIYSSKSIIITSCQTAIFIDI